MHYNFDKVISRENTDCVKYDLRKLIFKTDDLIPMWVADMDFESPDFVIDAINNRLKHPLIPYSIRGNEYHQSIIDWLETQHQWQIQRNWISFSPGVVPGLAMAIQAFSEVGDEVILQSPVYFPFYSCIKGTGRQIITNNLKEENGIYSMDLKDLENKITSKTKILMLCNPQNPIGKSWKREELNDLLKICKKHNLIVIADEIHSDLVFSPHKHIPFASLSEESANRTITFMSPSKTFNLAGISTSFAVISNPEMMKKYTEILEVLHLHIGNVFGTVASTAAYQQGHEWLNQLKVYLWSNIEFLDEFLQENIPQIKLIKPEATYLPWLDCRELQLSDDELNKFFIEKAKLGINTGISFGDNGSGFMRMNIACPKSILEKALNQLYSAITNMKNT